MTFTVDQIKERIEKIEREGKDPNTSEERRFLLRRFFRFWKFRLEEELEKTPPVQEKLGT